MFSPVYDNDEVSNDNLKTSLMTGWKSPLDAETIDRAGSGSWSTPTLAKAQSDSYANQDVIRNEYTDWIRATNFRFGFFGDIELLGIEVRIDVYGESVDVQDDSIRLVILGMAFGDDKATGTPLATSDSDTYTVYGASDDDWSFPYGQFTLEDENFGVQFSYLNTATNKEKFCYVDHIQIRLHYIEVDNDAPTWDTLTESSDPLLLGNNETININVYDQNTISNVYLEFGGTNYSMDLEYGDTYIYTNWLPTSVGVKTYQIHMIDDSGNINQTGDLTITVVELTGGIEEETDYSVINVGVMLLMMIIQSFYYFKVSVKSVIRFPIMFTTGVFSLFMTPLLMLNEVPATPFIQIYFMLYQIVVFFFSMWEYKLNKG